MKEIPDGSVDMILCDLPYGMTRNKWDNVIPLASLWSEYERIIKDNGSIVLFSQMPYTAELVKSNSKLFKYEWIWQKPNGTGFLNANKMPLKSHENILVFYKKLPTYNPQKTPGKAYKCKQGSGSSSWNYDESNGGYITKSDGKRFPKDIILFNRETGLHPTQKPVALLEYLIKTYTNEGEIVLDNCMGSGSTCVAAINTGRKYIGFELDEKYFEIAENRIRETVGAVKM